MKKISEEEVKHIAYLARIKLSDEEVKMYTKQLETILEYMDKLNELDTKNIEPVSHIISVLKNTNLQCNYREDEAKDSGLQEEILSITPDRVGKFFKVEKVIE